MAELRAPGYRWEQCDANVLLTFEVDPSTSLTDINVEIEEAAVRCWIEGQAPVICGQLHQLVLPKKSGWRLQSGEDVSTVCVSLFKRVPISWSYPIKGDIDADWPCDAQSHLLLAQFFATEGDINAEWHHLRTAADKGHPDALLALARVHLTGAPSFNVKPDVQQCRKLLESAADQSQPEAMLTLGQLHQEGAFGKVDTKAALHWYRLCLDDRVQRMFMRHTGDTSVPEYANIAHYNSAAILLSDPSPTNVRAALACLQMAADSGYARAFLKLGVMFFKGDIVEQDVSTGCEYVLTAVQLDPSLNIPHDILQAAQAYASTKGAFGVSPHRKMKGHGSCSGGSAGNAGKATSPLHDMHAEVEGVGEVNGSAEGRGSGAGNGGSTPDSQSRLSSSSSSAGQSGGQGRSGRGGRKPHTTDGDAGGVLGNATVSFGIAAAAVAMFLAFHLKGGQ